MGAEAPDLREQAVEAARAEIAYGFDTCTGFDDGCVRCARTRDVSAAVVAAVWPLAERAALDRAEKALRDAAETASRALPGIAPAELTEGAARGWNRAADLVASLRTEETRRGA